MALTKFKHNGGKVSVFPIMDGGMNCGYTINAFAPGSTSPFKTVSGTKASPNPLVFEDAGLIAEKTVVQVTFQFRAGNDALINSPYTIGLMAKQNGVELIQKATKTGVLPKLVKTSQLSLKLTTAETKATLTIGE